MAIIAATLKAKMETRIYNGLKAAFAADGKGNPEAEKNWQKQAKVMAAIAEDICEMLLTSVQVAPGIPVAVAGSPAAQSGATTAPGKLI